MVDDELSQGTSNMMERHLEKPIQGLRQAIRAVYLQGRQSTGSFLEASAFLYLNSGTNDDDPCYYEGDACADSTNDDGWVVSSASPTPTLTPTPASATCNCVPDTLDDYILCDILNIVGWADDGGAELQSQEEKCGKLSDWSFETSPRGSLLIRCRVTRVLLRWPAVHRVSRATDVLIAAFIASNVFASLNLSA